MQIEITVINKKAIAKDYYQIVCGNSDYTVKFSFDSEWDKYTTKTARFNFTQNGVKKYTDVVFEGTECNMPVLSGTSYVEIGVFAGDLQTTTPSFLRCEKSILCDNGTPEEPPEDVYNQIMEKCNEAVMTSNAVQQRADNGEFVGDKGEKGDKGDKGEKGDPFTYEDFTPEQLEDLKGEINEQQLKDAMYNLPIEVLENTFIHKTTGAKTSPTPSFHSLVYRVFGLSKIRSVNTKLSGNAGWSFYDKDNNVVASGNALTDIDVPSNAYTFAVSVYLPSMSAEDVAIYADFTNVLAYKSDLESCVRTGVSRIFNDDNANAKTKVISSAVKELYIPDETYKGILRFSAFRKITGTIGSIQLFAYINGTLTSIYRCTAQTVLYGTQLIKLERTSAYGEPAHILVDWDSVPDGASYTGNTSDIYLLNDKVFDKENSPTINGYIEENPYYNSDVVFDTCFAGEMSTQLLELKRNYNLPNKGMYISTDIDFYEKTSDIKGLIPYLYFNGEKIGTVVLYDTDGSPFIYLKDGTKKVLS